MIPKLALFSILFLCNCSGQCALGQPPYVVYYLLKKEHPRPEHPIRVIELKRKEYKYKGTKHFIYRNVILFDTLGNTVQTNVGTVNSVPIVRKSYYDRDMLKYEITRIDEADSPDTSVYNIDSARHTITATKYYRGKASRVTEYTYRDGLIWERSSDTAFPGSGSTDAWRYDDKMRIAERLFWNADSTLHDRYVYSYDEPNNSYTIQSDTEKTYIQMNAHGEAREMRIYNLKGQLTYVVTNKYSYDRFGHVTKYQRFVNGSRRSLERLKIIYY